MKEKKNKTWLFISIFLALCICFVAVKNFSGAFSLPNESYDYKTGRAHIRSHYVLGTGNGYVSSGQTMLLVTTNGETITNKEITYCADFGEAINWGNKDTGPDIYRRVNIEEANEIEVKAHNVDVANNANKLRAILKNVYPYVSIDTMKNSVKAYYQNNTTKNQSVANLTVQQAITATQWAIWTLTESDVDLSYQGTSALTKSFNYYYLEGDKIDNYSKTVKWDEPDNYLYRTAYKPVVSWVDYNELAKYDDSTESGNRIAYVKDWLLSLAPATTANNEKITNIVGHAVTTPGDGELMNVSIDFLPENSSASLSNVFLTDFQDQSGNSLTPTSTTSITNGKRVVFKNLNTSVTSINAQASAVQNTPSSSAYLYYPKDGSDDHQMLIGLSTSSNTNISNTAVTLVPKLEQAKYYVAKYDMTNHSKLAGATIEVVKVASIDNVDLETITGILIDSWSSTTSNPRELNLTVGEYVIRETSVPEGYTNSSPKGIKVLAEDLGKTYYEIVYNTKITSEVTTIKVIKYIKGTTTYLPGAQMELVKVDNAEAIDLNTATGVVIANWNTTSNIKNIDVDKGYYILREISAPEGYDKIAPILIEVNDENSGSVLIYRLYDEEMVPKTVHMRFSKKITGTDTYLEGASLELVRVDSLEGVTDFQTITGTIIATWNSSDISVKPLELEAGNYIFRETDTPNGYVTGDPVVFTLYERQYGQDFIKTLYNDPTQLCIRKIDTSNGKNLAGATLQLLDVNKNLIDEWQTTDEDFCINKLNLGTYFVKEVSAPKNYQIGKELTEFELVSSHDIKVVQIDNNPIIKVPITDKNKSIIIYIFGAIFIAIGVGVVAFYAQKRKNEN